MPRIEAKQLPPGRPCDWPMEYATSVGRLVDEGKPIEIICTTCGRITKITAEHIAKHAKSRDEWQNLFCCRLRCTKCGGGGAQNGFAYQHLWGRYVEPDRSEDTQAIARSL